MVRVAVLHQTPDAVKPIIGHAGDHMRTWAFITSALFFLAAFGAGAAGDMLTCIVLSLAGGAFIGTAL